MLKKITFNYIQISCSIIAGFIIGYFIFSNDRVVIEKKPFKKGTICLVIDDYGFIFNDMVRNFIELNSNFTVAIIPSSPYAKIISDYADSLNNEIIIHMPMESYELEKTNYEIELHEKLNADLVEQKIKRSFEEIPMAIGLNNHQGSRGTADSRVMTLLAKEIKNNKKFFIDSRTASNSIAESTMRKYGVPTNKRDVFLDNELDEEKIKIQLLKLAEKSEEKGIAIGIGHVKPQTLNVLSREIPELQKKGFRFEFVSNLVY